MKYPTADLWYSALTAQVGLIVQVTNAIDVTQKLYAIRQSLADPDLEGISIMTSPDNPDEIWLVKRRSSFNAQEREL